MQLIHSLLIVSTAQKLLSIQVLTTRLIAIFIISKEVCAYEKCAFIITQVYMLIKCVGSKKISPCDLPHGIKAELVAILGTSLRMEENNLYRYVQYGIIIDDDIHVSMS